MSLIPLFRGLRFGGWISVYEYGLLLQVWVLIRVMAFDSWGDVACLVILSRQYLFWGFCSNCAWFLLTSFNVQIPGYITFGH